MTLIKTSFFTGIATLVRTAAYFIIAKILAIYVGPAGFAIVGQFQNFIQIIQTFSGNMIQAGVVKYVAEYRDNQRQKGTILTAGLYIMLFSSILIGIILILLREWLAIKFLHNSAYAWILIVFAGGVILFSFNTFLISILNGERDIKKYTFSNVATSLATLVLTYILVVKFKITGALLALILGQSVVFFITLILVIKSSWFKWTLFNQKIEHQAVIKLFKYALMAVTSALVLPAAQIFLREYIAHNYSWDDAGYWQAVTRVSDGYLLLITTTLSVYYLPKLAELKTRREIIAEILQGYKIILPAAIILALGIFLFRHQVVALLFTNGFLPMVELFKFQLLGDVLKIGSWLIAFVMLAKSMTRLFILTEIGFTISYCLLAVTFSHFYGLIGITIGFAANYFLYWLFMAFVLRSGYGLAR